MSGTLFDHPAEVRAARDDGITRAEVHANPEWKDAARAAVAWCAHMRPTFTADDVWARLEATTDCSTHNPAALGPVVLGLAREGLIVKTGRMVRTKYARRHRDLVEWRAPSTYPEHTED